MKRIALFLAAPFMTALLIMSGCDSGDPIDRPEPRDVAGQYSFTEFRFQPVGGAVQPINVLDTLDQSGTDLRLSSDGTFILSFEFLNGSPFFLNGQFSVSESTVRIEGSDSQNSTYARLLLSPDFTLRRNLDQPGLLTAEISRVIDPSAFSNRYRGVPSLDGKLFIRLEER
jgi:hypothetical protein